MTNLEYCFINKDIKQTIDHRYYRNNNFPNRLYLQYPQVWRNANYRFNKIGIRNIMFYPQALQLHINLEIRKYRRSEFVRVYNENYLPEGEEPLSLENEEEIYRTIQAYNNLPQDMIDTMFMQYKDDVENNIENYNCFTYNETWSLKPTDNLYDIADYIEDDIDDDIENKNIIYDFEDKDHSNDDEQTNEMFIYLNEGDIYCFVNKSNFDSYVDTTKLKTLNDNTINNFNYKTNDYSFVITSPWNYEINKEKNDDAFFIDLRFSEDYYELIYDEYNIRKTGDEGITNEQLNNIKNLYCNSFNNLFLNYYAYDKTEFYNRNTDLCLFRPTLHLKNIWDRSLSYIQTSFNDGIVDLGNIVNNNNNNAPIKWYDINEMEQEFYIELFSIQDDSMCIIPDNTKLFINAVFTREE